MRLVQFKTQHGERHVGIASDDKKGALNVLRDTASVYDLAQAALASAASLAKLAAERASGEMVDYDTIITVGRLLPPLDHPRDPGHVLVTGTGLTHLGSADARDQMHKNLQKKADENTLTDSMKIFKIGLEGGKPAGGGIGSQPEWFYKGDGQCVVAPEHPFEMPAFALDGGDEAEVVGLYLIAADGTPCRVGFALGNEFSDHVLERQNYLYLAHSKLRQCAFGPELVLGELPPDVRGNARVLRDGKIIWEKSWLSGDDNMTHAVRSLEYHHFKYPMFRRPGDVHVHYFGAATLSFAEGVKTQPGDVFEISAEGFGRPLRNGLKKNAAEPAFTIKTL